VSGFSAKAGGASARFGAAEAQILASFATQLATTLAERGEHDDPVLRRLLPDAYRDDDENAAEFRRFTEDELSDEKVRNALAVAEALQSGRPNRSVKVELDAAGTLAWLRALADLRLALAVRLRVDDDGEPTSATEATPFNVAVYHWLAQLQDSLVRAVDR
jgi:hypothetical protein